MKKSNVTVIIPCYNDGEYILKAVDSALKQTSKPEKIIIIDDGSDIKTKSVLKTIKDDIIEIIYQKNLGVCKARNIAIAQAKTDYILTLDADDFFEPTFIEKAIKILDQDQKVGVVGCYFRWFNEENNNLHVIKTPGGQLDDFLYGNKGVGNAIFRKICWEQVGGYDENMRYGYEDWEFWIAIAAMGWKYDSIPEILFNYRRKNESRDSIAKSNYDILLKKYIFIKHQKHYAKNIDETLNYVFNLAERKVKEKEKIINSINYRFGKKILNPIRKIRRIINSWF
ncbi:glycosyltransferase family 2 protein [Mesoflavibacter zeaxanthinifaciens]|uniref:glycosyltransferase family 2 protein n=1 Tax=Mesoflavibacter zeaxanthinifaciens TaxID=393060 RepID=UPI003A8EC928